MIEYSELFDNLEETNDQIHVKSIIRQLQEELSPSSYESICLKLSKAFANRGDFDKAIWILEEAYELNASPRFAQELSTYNFQLENYENALEWSDLALADGLNYNALYLRAKILIELNELEQAEELLKELIKSDEVRYEGYLTLGELYFSMNNYQGAITYLEPVYDYLDDQLSDDDLRRVRLMIIEAKLNSEIVDLAEIKTLFEKGPEALSATEYYYLALVNFYQDNLAEAEEAALKAVELDSDEFGARILLLEIYQKQSNINKLTKTLNSLVNDLPPFSEELLDILEIAAGNQIHSNVLADSLEEMLPLLEDFDDWYQVVSYITDVKAQTSPQEALDFISGQVDSMDKEYAVSYYLAHLNGLLGNIEEADDYYEIALDYLVETEKTLVSYLNYLYKNKEYSDAQDLYQSYEGQFQEMAELDEELEELIKKIRTEGI